MKSVGKGTVEERKKGAWRIRVTVTYDDGSSERLSKSVACRNKTEARKALDAWRAELLTSTVDIRRRNLKLGDYLNEHLDYCRDVLGLSPSTLRGYRDIVNERFAGPIADLSLCEIKPFMIDEHLAHLRKEGGRHGRPLSGTTVKRAYDYLNSALRRAVALEYIAVNPCDKVKPPKKESFEAKPLTKEDVQRIMILLAGHPSPQFSMACRLALATGMRRGEICGLQWEDIDFEKQQIHVNKSLVEDKCSNHNGTSLILKECKTEKSNRWIAIDDFTFGWIKIHQVQQYYRLTYNGIEQTGETPVCSNDLGEWYRPSACTSDFVPFRNQHGFDFTRLHDMRHTQASLLLQAGEDIVTVSRRLGHSKVSTTLDIYSHLMPGKDRSAAEKIGAIFSVPNVV